MRPSTTTFMYLVTTSNGGFLLKHACWFRREKGTACKVMQVTIVHMGNNKIIVERGFSQVDRVDFFLTKWAHNSGRFFYGGINPTKFKSRLNLKEKKSYFSESHVLILLV